MTNRTIDEVIFYCKGVAESFTIKSKAVHQAWPKLLHAESKNAIEWAKRSRPYNKSGSYFTTTVANNFSNSELHDNVSIRGYSSKVPCAVVYNNEHDVYLLFDFRADGLVETMCGFSISKGIIKTDMAFRFSGGNYYFVPRKGDTFKEYENNFIQTHVSKSKATMSVKNGAFFYGNYNDIYAYLGKFLCTKDDTEVEQLPLYDNEYVHIYVLLSRFNPSQKVYMTEQSPKSPYIAVSKSKMKVKNTIEENSNTHTHLKKYYDSLFNGNDRISTTRFTKASYGTHNIKLSVDFKATSVSMIEIPAAPKRNCRNIFF